MSNIRPLTNDEGEVRELMEEDFARFVPFSALSPELQVLLFSPKQVVPDAEGSATSQPAA
jgi:hypothetical protein